MDRHPDCDDPTCLLGYRHNPQATRDKRNTRCPICRPEPPHPLAQNRKPR